MEYPLHQLIRVGCLEINIALSNHGIDVRTITQGFCVAIIGLSLSLI